MRVLLISANTEQVNVPVFPFGLACVATAVQNAGHEVNLINLMDEADKNDYLETGIKAFRPEVIGISVRNIDDQSRQNTKFLLEPVKGIVDLCRALSDALPWIPPAAKENPNSWIPLSRRGVAAPWIAAIVRPQPLKAGS